MFGWTLWSTAGSKNPAKNTALNCFWNPALERMEMKQSQISEFDSYQLSTLIFNL